MSTTPPHTTKPTLQFDWQDWLPGVEGSDLTDAQKREMIEALWSIVIAFVDLGWEVGNAPTETGGQTIDLCAALRAAVVHSKEQLTTHHSARRTAVGQTKEEV